MSRSMNVDPVQITSPVWTNDFLGPEHLLQGSRLDPAQFIATDAVRVTVSGAAAGGAVAIPVTALSGPIPSGTMLDFGGAKLAITTAAVAAGAVSIPVRALPTALAGGEVATYAGKGDKTVPAGTAVGRTIAERDLSAGYGPAVDTDDEIFITAFTVLDAADIPDVVLVRPNTTLKENYLPGWSGYAAALKTKIRAAYRCMRGAD